MLKAGTALFAALIMGWGLTAPTQASAGYRGQCCCGGPLPPKYTYRTVHKVSHLTRYRDVSRTHYVQRIRPIIHVTRIRPVVRLHVVTRVHHRTVPVVHNVHRQATQWLPAQTIETNSVQNTYDCRCSSGSYGY